LETRCSTRQNIQISTSTKSASLKVGPYSKEAAYKVYSLFFSLNLPKKDGDSLSKEWTQKTLIDLGFTKTDAQVYVFLSTEGAKQAKDIVTSLNLNRKQLYHTLKNLQSNRMVNVSRGKPNLFSAVPFEEVLELFIKTKKEQQEAWQASKEELLSNWRYLIKKENTGS
jgi:predicted transcriptional regulator